jgi:putative two-component system response regulator
VLVLDDEPFILRALRRALAMAGLDVTTAERSSDALAILEREAPDVVVTDLHMPHEDGAHFLSEVARQRPDAVRVLLSADLDFGASGEGAHALVSKSEMPQLTELVVAMLEARFTTPETPDEIASLAARFARALSRPRHEDDGHRERVAKLSAALAKGAGMSSSEIFEVTLGATLHDVGQITLPEQVFAYGGRLTAEHRAALERHPDAGAWLLSHMPALRHVAPIVRAHHTRLDGTGYPSAIDVPPAARVVQVADAYDAICSGRPWAPARSHADAIAELEACVGAQLDGDVVRALSALR